MKAFGILLALLLLAQPLWAGESQHQKEIHAAIDAMIEASNQGDFDRYEAFLTKDFVFSAENPPYTHNRAESLAAQKNGYETNIKLNGKRRSQITTQVLRFEKLNETDYSVGLELTNRQTFKGKPVVTKIRIEETWTRQDGHWLCKREHHPR